MKPWNSALCLAVLTCHGLPRPLTAQSKPKALAEPIARLTVSKLGAAPKGTLQEAPEAGCTINKDGVWEKSVRIAPGVDLELIHVCAGSFLMGSADDQGFREETPQHRVAFGRGFWMGKYPLTQAQWRAIKESNPSTFPGGDRPFDSATWDDAVEYLQSLNRKLGRSGDQIFRLPTEAQWEYACRAGTTTEFSFGNDENLLIHYGWHSRNAARTSHPVGQFPQNPWGLYDMHGNVWQWCEDLWNRNYKGAPPDGSAWMSGGGLFSSKHVMRGGSWHVNATWCRCAARYHVSPDMPFGSCGFRLVLPEGPTQAPQVHEKP